MATNGKLPVVLSTIAGTILAAMLWWVLNTILETSRKHQAAITRLEANEGNWQRTEARLDLHLAGKPQPHEHTHGDVAAQGQPRKGEQP